MTLSMKPQSNVGKNFPSWLMHAISNLHCTMEFLDQASCKTSFASVDRKKSVMAQPHLEEVFKRSGVPTFTFVEPREFGHLKVALRTAGRGLVIEGPSGIGKTTAVVSALADLNLTQRAQRLSARVTDDQEIIEALPSITNAGIVIIDDFHRLTDYGKRAIADYMKDLADREDERTKIVLIGINKAGDTLVSFASDLNNRIETIHFEVNSQAAIAELLHKGEQALNIQLSSADSIAEDAGGSFHIAQILGYETCLAANVLECCDYPTEIRVGLESVKDRVLGELSRAFLPRAIKFARGRRFRREGRAPYLHLLYALARSNEWTLNIDDVITSFPTIRGSVTQVVDKGHLQTFLEDEGLREIFHYDNETRVLGVEDPKFLYFARNLLWSKFVRQAGYISVEFRSRYDFALSFAGENRAIAELLYQALRDAEMEVFYDKEEQSRILAQDVENYLAPIYRSEARFVIPLLSAEFPKKIWTKFESDQFKSRFGTNSVIPIWFSDAPPGLFDETRKLGGITFDSAGDCNVQIAAIAETLVRKVGEERQQEEQASRSRAEGSEEAGD
jgi:hypothetical protein